jgi:hypothetical protein
MTFWIASVPLGVSCRVSSYIWVSSSKSSSRRRLVVAVVVLSLLSSFAIVSSFGHVMTTTWNIVVVGVSSSFGRCRCGHRCVSSSSRRCCRRLVVAVVVAIVSLFGHVMMTTWNIVCCFGVIVFWSLSLWSSLRSQSYLEVETGIRFLFSRKAKSNTLKKEPYSR